MFFLITWRAMRIAIMIKSNTFTAIKPNAIHHAELFDRPAINWPVVFECITEDLV